MTIFLHVRFLNTKKIQNAIILEHSVKVGDIKAWGQANTGNVIKLRTQKGLEQPKKNFFTLSAISYCGGLRGAGVQVFRVIRTKSSMLRNVIFIVDISMSAEYLDICCNYSILPTHCMFSRILLMLLEIPNNYFNMQKVNIENG